MKKVTVTVFVMICAAAITLGLTQGFKNIREFLIGYEEVPALSTLANVANGMFTDRMEKSSADPAIILASRNTLILLVDLFSIRTNRFVKVSWILSRVN